MDITDLPLGAHCTHSGTGFGNNVKAAHKKKGTQFSRFNERGCAASSHVGIKPHLGTHYALAEGMPTLKEALKMLTRYYPELLECIYFYNSPWWFHPIFSVFSLWVRKETRKKFCFVKKGAPPENFWTISKQCLSADFGGTAWSHGGENGDDFIERAIKLYDDKPKPRKEKK